MSKGLLLKSVTGFFTAMLAVGSAVASSTSLQCETLGENNSICLSDVESKAAPKAAVAANAGRTASMLTREDVSGAALDLDNEFESNTLLGDATAVQMRVLAPAVESQSMQARIVNVDDLLHNVVFSSPQTRVGAARVKTK